MSVAHYLVPIVLANLANTRFYNNVSYLALL